MLTAFRADLSGRSVAYERFLIFDDDIWRYLWDGHVWAGGVNPYRFAPQDPAVDGLSDGSGVWNDIRHSVNHASTPTIYPPLADVKTGESLVVDSGGTRHEFKLAQETKAPSGLKNGDGVKVTYRASDHTAMEVIKTNSST